MLQEIANQVPPFEKKEKKLHIFDARALKAAMGNTVMGAGHEGIVGGYKFCDFHFLNIGIYTPPSLPPPLSFPSPFP